MSIAITTEQARSFLTLLHFPDSRPAARPVLDHSADPIAGHLERLGSIQFDPLDVVGRNPDLVLQSRIEGYRPGMLYAALYERPVLFEGFDKNLCIFHRNDFPAFRRTRRRIAAEFRDNPEIERNIETVLSWIESAGPVSSDDLDLEGKVSWPWGTTRLSRAVLESLWMAGRLAIHHRRGSRRYYDLIERCLPRWIVQAPDPNPTDTEYFAWQLHRRIRSVGLLTGGASDALLGITGFKAAQRRTALESLLAEGRLLAVRIEDSGSADGSRQDAGSGAGSGSGTLDAYIAREDEPVLRQAMEHEPEPRARIMAPLDNLMWDRKLIERLFGFRYRWEVYTPKHKREYGYYVLPVMLGNRFVARFEPERFRGGTLRIAGWWWEDGVTPTPRARAAIREALDAFCGYLGADGIEGAP